MMHNAADHEDGKKSVEEQVREREAKRINDMIVKKAQEQAQRDKETAERARRSSFAGRRFSMMGRRASESGAPSLASVPGERRPSVMSAILGGGGRRGSTTGGLKKSTFMGNLFGGGSPSKNARFAASASGGTQLFNSAAFTVPEGDVLTVIDTAKSSAPTSTPSAARAAPVTPAAPQSAAGGHGQSYQSGGGMTRMPSLVGSAPVQAVRTKLIERLAKGGPVSVDQRREMQGLLDRWEAAGGSHADVAYLMLTRVYGASSVAASQQRHSSTGSPSTEA